MNLTHRDSCTGQKRQKLVVTVLGIMLQKLKQAGVSRRHKTPEQIVLKENSSIKELFKDTMIRKNCQVTRFELTNAGHSGMIAM